MLSRSVLQQCYNESLEDHYRQIYFGALDHAIEAIHDRFDQPGYRIYQDLEQLIVKTSKGNPYNDELDEVYGSDLSRDQLEVQLPLLQKSDEEVEGIHDIIKILCELSSSERIGFSYVWTAVKLLLVMPATNATSERSSALRRIKS